MSACAGKIKRDDRGWQPVTGVDPAQVDAFRVAGRLAVSDGREGGSAGFLWTQQGDAYEFELRQPVSQRTWRLVGDRRGAILEGADDGPRRGPSAEALLSEALGWRVPVEAMRYWIRGRPHPWVRGAPFHGPMRGSQVDDRDRLRRFEQDGWDLEYRAWLDDGPWPIRITARNAPYSVRLSVQDWSVRDE